MYNSGPSRFNIFKRYSLGSINLLKSKYKLEELNEDLEFDTPNSSGSGNTTCTIDGTTTNLDQLPAVLMGIWRPMRLLISASDYDSIKLALMELNTVAGLAATRPMTNPVALIRQLCSEDVPTSWIVFEIQYRRTNQLWNRLKPNAVMELDVKIKTLPSSVWAYGTVQSGANVGQFNAGVSPNPVLLQYTPLIPTLGGSGSMTPSPVTMPLSIPVPTLTFA